MSDSKKVHQDNTSSSDADVGTSQPTGFLARRKVDLNDLGKEYFEKSLQYDEAQLERDAIKVRRKLDFIVLPMMMTTYMLSFLDKQT